MKTMLLIALLFAPPPAGPPKPVTDYIAWVMTVDAARPSTIRASRLSSLPPPPPRANASADDRARGEAAMAAWKRAAAERAAKYRAAEQVDKARAADRAAAALQKAPPVPPECRALDAYLRQAVTEEAQAARNGTATSTMHLRQLFGAADAELQVVARRWGWPNYHLRAP